MKVLHCHNTFPLISPSTYAVAREMNVPVVQTLHNYRLVCPNPALLRAGRIREECLGKRLAWPAVADACHRDNRAASAAVSGMPAYLWPRGTWTKSVDRYVAPSEFLKQSSLKGDFPKTRYRCDLTSSRTTPALARVLETTPLSLEGCLRRRAFNACWMPGPRCRGSWS